MTRHRYLIGIAAGALGCAVSPSAVAQTAPVTGTPPPSGPVAQSAAPAAPAAEPSAADPQSTDIIVTATLRAENLQRVPVAVTAFNGAALQQAGVTDLRNLKSVAPSFSVINAQSESGATTIQVRGIGTSGNNPGFDLAVGLFIDDVYISRAGIALGDLLDVSQVELLRGPQGTLFGRNTTSGAVRIGTAKPNLSRIEGFANATYGNYDLKNVQAGVSIPLIADKVGLRVSGAWRDRDGVLRNADGVRSNDRNRYIVRGQLYAEPTPDLTIRLIGDYSKSNEHCCDAVITRDSSLATRTLATVGGVGLTAYGINGLPSNGGVAISGATALDEYRTANVGRFLDRSRQWGASGTVEWSVGAMKLTSITAYRDFRANTREESDFVALAVLSASVGGTTATANSRANVTKVKTFTQEVRIAGSAFADRLDFVAGAYFADEQIAQQVSQTLGRDHQPYISAILTSIGVPGVNAARTIFANGISSEGAFAVNAFDQSARNWSVFGNATFAITERLKLNGGLRYSNDRKDAAFDQLAASNAACDAARANAALFATLPATDPRRALAAAAPLAASLTCFGSTSVANRGPGTPQTFDRTFTDDALIYTAKLMWNPIEAVNGYASFTHGYKSGGFNLDATAAINGANPAFRSETVDAYEIGVKTKLGSAFTVNLAVFDQKVRNYQLLEFTGSQFVAYNVPKVYSRGVEVEAVMRPSRRLSVSQAVTYLDARYAKDCDNGIFVAAVSSLCGYSLFNTAKWNVVTGVNWWQPVTDRFKTTFAASMRFESDRRASPQAIIEVAAGTGSVSVADYPGGVTNNYVPFPSSIQDANAKINLRVGFGDIEDRWTIEGWVDNVTDEHTLGTTFRTAFRGVATLPGPVNAGGASAAVASFVQDPRTYGLTVRSRF